MADSYSQARRYALLLRHYKRKHLALVKPNQGWASLHQDLWLAYSIGRKRGYYDVGTYANKPGDHGFYPAWAFDLRRKGWRGWFGWGRKNAQKLAAFYWENYLALNIEYVIVGTSLISRKKPYWHPLRTGDKSHEYHVHVSGHH